MPHKCLTGNQRYKCCRLLHSVWKSLIGLQIVLRPTFGKLFEIYVLKLNVKLAYIKKITNSAFSHSIILLEHWGHTRLCHNNYYPVQRRRKRQNERGTTQVNCIIEIFVIKGRRALFFFSHLQSSANISHYTSIVYVNYVYRIHWGNNIKAAALKNNENWLLWRNVCFFSCVSYETKKDLEKEKT